MLIEINIKAKKTVAPPPSPTAAPVGTLALEVGKSYRTRAGLRVTIKIHHETYNHFRTEDGWWYEANGLFCDLVSDPLFPKHLVCEDWEFWKEALAWEKEGKTLEYSNMHDQWASWPSNSSWKSKGLRHWHHHYSQHSAPAWPIKFRIKEQA